MQQPLLIPTYPSRGGSGKGTGQTLVCVSVGLCPLVRAREPRKKAAYFIIFSSPLAREEQRTSSGTEAGKQ